MNKRSSLIGLLALASIVLVFGYLFLNQNNRLIENISYQTESNTDQNEIRKVIESIDNEKPATVVVNKIKDENKICSNFDSKLTNSDLKEQEKLVKETIEKLNDKKTVNDVLYELIPKNLDDG